MPSKGVRAERDGAEPIDFETFTIANDNAQTLVRVPDGNGQVLVGALIECQTFGVRYRVDGGNASQTSGHTYLPGQTDYLNAQEIRKFSFANATAGQNGVLVVTYYRG